MARILKGSHSFTCTPRVHPLTEWTTSWFSFTDPRGMEGWIGLGGWLHTEIKVRHRQLNPDMVTHLSTNRARRRLTSLLETQRAMPQRHQVTAICLEILLMVTSATWFTVCCCPHSQTAEVAGLREDFPEMDLDLTGNNSAEW